jgi:hypothetical protein
MTGDDVTVTANQDGVGKAEGTNAAGDFGDLSVAVRACISWRRNEPINRPKL